MRTSTGRRIPVFGLLLPAFLGVAATSPVQAAPDLSRLKAEAAAEVDRLSGLTQQMVDMVFSFGEVGFEEVETSRYLTGILRKHGFKVEEGVAGLPTGWVATWGRGKPVIALGADLDGLPQASQKPGIAFRAPLVEGGPGHGEGHNAGMPLQITAALAVKKILEREKLGGTIKLWPGVAEELLGGKAHYVRAGVFRGVDAVLFAHVDGQFRTFWGEAPLTGLVSVEYRFVGQSSHAAGSPWRGRSALDAVELMNIGWNFRREHLRLQQRSHYVVTNGGDQPNIVPPEASVWYYFRELDYDHIKELWEVGNKIAKAAAQMTDTEVSWKVLGNAWPIHTNKPLAEATYANIKAVGMPAWSEADQTLAKATQKLMGSKDKGLEKEIAKLPEPATVDGPRVGGSDDIGDVSWTVPTTIIRFPANIPDVPFHHWSAAIAMATPIAHKGTTAGAKAAALTVLDMLTKPELVKAGWDYFNNVQTKDIKYTPFLGANDKPPVHLNRRLMEQHRPALRKHHFNPTKYKTYLEQLGVKYPTVR